MGSTKGRIDQVLWTTVLGRGMGTRVLGMNEAGSYPGNEGILGNNFAMAQELTVRLHEGAVYLPAFSITGKEDMGERLPCAVRSLVEVRAITEEVLAVRALRTVMLAPRTVSQVSVIIPTPRPGGTVMGEAGPGLLGLCPVRGVTEVERDSKIWVANLGSHPVEVEENQVVATAECVTEGPGTCLEDEGSGADEAWYDARPHISIRGNASNCRQP